jgi:hypothetical protein
MMDNFMDNAQKPNAYGLNLPCEWKTHTWMMTQIIWIMTWNIYFYNDNLLLFLD